MTCNVRLLAVWLIALLAGTAVAAEELPSGFELNLFNGSVEPRTEAGITTFTIRHGECSDVEYPDGRGESDCKNGNVRSVINSVPPVEAGRTVEYRFDIRIDPAFQYSGYANDELFDVILPDRWDSALRLASWEGNYLHNFIYRLSADTRRGLMFVDKQCQAPEDFGTWVAFSLQVHWTNNTRGWVKATCDGKTIYLKENVESTQAPHCYPRNQCEPGIRKDPSTISFLVGPVMEGHGHTWREQGRDSPFNVIQPEGITVQVRNLKVSDASPLYGPPEKEMVRQLQTVLNRLGCDVGPADGIAGKRTAEAALSCRAFPDGAPPEFNVETLPRFLELYTSDGVEDLPAGTLPTETPRVSASEVGSEKPAASNEVVTMLEVRVSNDHPALDKFSVLVIGRYNPNEELFDAFNLQIHEAIPKVSPALEACPMKWIEDHGADGHRLAMQFERRGNAYVAPGAECITAALPARQAEQAKFLTSRFREVASAMARDSTIDSVTQDALRAFLKRVAEGALKVGL